MVEDGMVVGEWAASARTDKHCRPSWVVLPGWQRQ